MKHFVVINDYSHDFESGVDILGVAHSLEVAMKIFDKRVGYEREIASQDKLEVYEDCDTCFDAGGRDSYARNHTRLYIEGV